MFDCQQALIAHLNSATSFNAKTIKEYAGEANEASKLTTLLPAALVMFISSSPALSHSRHQFDILCVQQSRVFDKKTARNTNLAFATDVVKHLLDNPIFKPLTGSGTFVVNTTLEDIKVRTILQDERFTIIAASLLINDLTK